MDVDEVGQSEAGKTSPQPLTGDGGSRAAAQQPDDSDAVMRANRRRLALVGLATGAVMAVIVLLCLLLAVLLTSQ